MLDPVAQDPSMPFEDHLARSGLPKRIINALIYEAGVQSLEDLRARRWGSIADEGSLCWELNRTPKLGPRGIAQIKAVRAEQSPTTVEPRQPTAVTTTFSAATLHKLDLWIADQETAISRSDAIQALVVAGLKQLMGHARHVSPG
jgi:hypothetical protein